MKLAQTLDAIISNESAEHKQELATWVASDERRESKYARTLVQLDNGVKVGKGNWRCARCEKTENLWMNLSTGEIGCGRKNFDGTGGNGHALEHFKDSSFPLVVKLGTITPDGTADVYSYAPEEDDMVLDPLLEQHLAHWGIDMKEMRKVRRRLKKIGAKLSQLLNLNYYKTDKSVAELEIELQHSFDWTRILGSEKDLKPVYGPGLTGMENLGNSYVNLRTT